MDRLKVHLENTAGMTEAEWVVIKDHLKPLQLRKGDYFIEEGSPARRCGFLLSGLVRYFSRDRDGNDPTCYFRGEHTYMIDPFSFGKQSPSHINIQAITACSIAHLGYDADQRLLRALPRWRQIADKVMLDVSLDFGEQKAMMSMSALERYAFFLQRYPEVARSAPLGYVASYLGITRSSLSRLRRKLVSARPA